ncbi:MAG: DUF2459 domain-containing protein [Proteobacteria bacterium]|nr:DUF2459 domain-containing protein [Pseudomonadota bacterium]
MRRRVIIAALLTLALVATPFLVRLPGDVALFPAKAGEATVTAYVVDNGFHTNVVLPAEVIRAHGGPMAEARAATAPGAWIQIGWGDTKFYMDPAPISHRLPDGARAFFAAHNPSAVMLEPLQARPDRLWTTGVRRLELSRAGTERLLSRADASFALRAGHIQPVFGPDTQDARFFKSREAFSILHLCNHWTSALLHAAGLSTRPLLDTVSAGVMLDVADAQLDRAPKAR